MTTHPLAEIAASFHSGRAAGITSVCSAHPIVIEAALRLARKTGRPALIEATCNQVNQEGGYTGMTPADFRRLVEETAGRVGLDRQQVILGGDHLGPNPWKDLPAETAMARAEETIAAYARAGFTKLHLDTSMGCSGEPAGLSDEMTASRAARLAGIAESSSPGTPDPVYVIGTEVPTPGGSLGELTKARDEITSPDAVGATFDAHRRAFREAGLEAAFSRVIALVVQPGVEFGHSEVLHFDPAQSEALTAALHGLPGIVFEAHSTDYQTKQGLRSLVAGGFAVLKVGPWLTFALREALYGLDCVADALDGNPPRGRLMVAMDDVMRASPKNWSGYYHGDATELWRQRHFSYSDRIRYYWPDPAARSAVERLRRRLDGRRIPGPILSQFLCLDGDRDIAGNSVDDVLIAAVQRVLGFYDEATAGDP